MILPDDLKIVGFALRAFNVEIATVADQVSEKITGEMRFQFWQDAIDKIYAKDVPNHPICIQLAKVINFYRKRNFNSCTLTFPHLILLRISNLL